MARYKKTKKLNLKTFVKDVKLALVMDAVQRLYKPYVKGWATEAMLTIPTSGTGFLAKKTVITSGRGKPPATRAETRAAQLKLGNRRKGNSESDLQKSIQTALSKIDRMKDERLAKIVQREGTLVRLSFGAYYAPFVAPRYDTGRRKLPKVVSARLKSKRLKR